MLDLKLVREQPDLIRQAATKKRLAPERVAAVDRVLEYDGERRSLLPRVEAMRAEQKAAGRKLAGLGPEQRDAHLEGQKRLKEELTALEARISELDKLLEAQMLLLPNVPSPETPDGASDRDNVEVRRAGKPPEFTFAPRSHDDLALAQGWLDVERAAAMAGSRNYMLFGDLALLHDAVLRLGVEHMVHKGFVPVDPPLLVRDQVMTGTGFFPGGEEQTYRCQEDQLNLIGTSEVPVTSIHAGEILDEGELPKRYVARSACFRREAGTYGKDTKGLYRVHQFHKVEQVIVDVADEARSRAHHEQIVKNAEEVLALFELPYRVVLVCGGDLGVPQVQKYDIECWMPSRQAFGETHSASRFHDFQARRLGLRYRRRADKKVAFCHTLNNTVLASPRILIALLEIHQQKDGTVRLPAALRGHLGGREVLGRPLS
jgi:seryl-tRNA synthetase